jgi:hypothetical protein
MSNNVRGIECCQGHVKVHQSKSQSCSAELMYDCAQHATVPKLLSTHLLLLAPGDPVDDVARCRALEAIRVHQRLQHVLEGPRMVRQEQLALPQIMKCLAPCMPTPSHSVMQFTVIEAGPAEQCMMQFDTVDSTRQHVNTLPGALTAARRTPGQPLVTGQLVHRGSERKHIRLVKVAEVLLKNVP